MIPSLTRHSVVLSQEVSAVRSTSLALVELTSFEIDAHVRKMVRGSEGQEDAVSARRILTRAVALLVASGSVTLEDLSGDVVPVDLVESGRQMRDRIAVVGHSPARLSLSLQPGREGLITNTRRTEGGQLDADGAARLVKE